MTFRRAAVLAIAGIAMAVPAVAHHSFNTFFDMARTIKVEGVVTSFKLMSPHSEMLLDVSGPDGKVVPWRVTARTGAVTAKRQGWRPQDFIGKRVTVEGNPSRNPGAPSMTAGVVTFEDGKVVCLGGCPGGPPIE